MAIITKIEKNNKNYTMRGGLSFCEAEYNDYTYLGEKYVRIQTFGSSDRQEKGKQSQVIHLNKTTAKQLVEYLKQSFGL
ncbi:MAG: hypothetical protein SPK59_02950 [Eubacteriales bacterium]|nr:hypothetical protein [Eubacteriales bacterium]